MLIGVGKSLQPPCLQDGQQLDGARVSRIFAQKVIWLRPSENISFTEDTAPQDEIQDDQIPITDLLPVSYALSFLYLCIFDLIHIILFEEFSVILCFELFKMSKIFQHAYSLSQTLFRTVLVSN